MSDIYTSVKRVPKSLYPAVVVLKSAYTFLERAYLHIDESESEWIISIEAKEDALDASSLLSEFENELITQSVRERVYQETKTIREVLMARAMASTMIDTRDPIETIQAEQSDISEEELQIILKDWFEDHAE